MSFSQRQERTSISVLANALGRQEGKYRKFIEDNDHMGSGLAMRVARGEQFENLLGEEITEEYRQSLKTFAKDNVAKERQLKAYMNAIKVVTENHSSSQENDDENENESQDFQQQMEASYTKELQTIENNSVMVTQEQKYLKLCRQLGQEEDQDDELAIVNPNSTDSVARIKCPITAIIMDEPVRSKVCMHAFTKAAILNHLTMSRFCPMPGCGNDRMTRNELEDDPDTALLVRRHKKRKEHAKRSRAQAQSALDMDDDDDFE